MNKSYLVAASTIGIAASAMATVSSTLVADTYIVKDGAGASAKFYAVLDIYAKGNHLGDVMGGILGVTGHDVVFATSSAQGVTRDATSGKVTGGTITSDIFVQSGGSSWLPTNTDGKAWDSFIANGNRRQGDSITNRAATVKNLGDAANWSAASAFTQMGVANSNFINNSSASGWFTAFGSNPYLSGTAAVASENPWARVSLYNSNWNATYGDLYRGADVLYTKGQMQTGRTTAAGAAVLSGAAGDRLDFHWMVGRFAIDLTGKTSADVITMQVQFNMIGRNGTGNEAGGTFSGAIASTAQYKVSRHFTFAMPTEPPPPPPQAPTGVLASDGVSTSGVTIAWNAPPGNQSSYSVMRSTGGQTPIEIGSPTANSFTDTTAVPGTLYSYLVYAIGPGGTSPASAPDTGWRRLSPPSSVTASDGTFGSRVDVAWAASTGATSYKVQRATVGGTPAVIGTPALTAFVDTTAVPGQTYEYSVLASCALGDSDPSAIDTGSRMIDCNDNGVVDSIDLNPPVSIASGNMGTLAGLVTRSATLAITQAPVSGVNVSVDALGDLDSDTEYLILKITKAGTTTPAITRELFKADGQGCPATPQRTSFALTAQELQNLLGGPVGNLKIDVTPTTAVGLADSTCQANSSVSVTLAYIARNASIDCNSNGVIDTCEIASGAVADCNANGVPDSCEFAAGTETDLNGNGVLDRCEYLVGSPAYPSIALAVSAAPNGTVVPVLPGTYDGPVDLGSKGLTLRSTGGKGVTTIRGSATGSTVRVAGGGQIEGFFIQGGGGDTESGVRRGGALRITAGSVTIKDCDIRAGDVGSSGEGGLVFIRDASPNFLNCRLEMGTAGLGGGVYARATTAAVRTPSFVDCLIRLNSATAGGGVFLRGSGMKPLLTRVNFEQNIGSTDGGALYALEGARASLTGCRACGNTVPVVVGGYDEPGLNWMTDDCNTDGICDADQLSSGALSDDDADGIPDACQDCDGDGESDRYAIAQGWVPDCNGNQIPDSCDIAAGAADCNGNGIPDSCDVTDVAFDCNRDGQLDECQSLPDCNGNGKPDVCDISAGTALDCNANGVPDSCDLADGTGDCNANGIPDACDIAAGRDEDQDGGGVPDACQYAVGDLDLSGGVDTADVGLLLLFFDTTGPIGDLDGDGLVTTADLALLLLNFD